jgi:DNA (cytosine-5)-methyltransferase 3A
MKVLSLFDGISCARVALERAGIPVEVYYASEIDKNAMKVSAKNYPDIIQVGDIKNLCGTCDTYDLLIGGSPCQDLSIAKQGRKGLDGDRSGLFWEYVRIWKVAKPTWFLLENVASMPQKDKDIITKEMGVEPVMFNASLVSAQSRKRLFWTNIPFALPEDKGVLLRDILQPDAEVDERMFCVAATYSHVNRRTQVKQVKQVKLGHIGNSDSQGSRVYDTDGKSVCLSANGGGSGAKTGLYAVAGRSGVRADDELTSVPKDNLVVLADDFSAESESESESESETRIRKLTPIECERLQCLPDNYTEGIAMTNRYKCLGNAFCVDVVAHILQGLKSTSPAPDQIPEA